VKYLVEAGADVNMTVENGEHGNALIAVSCCMKGTAIILTLNLLVQIRTLFDECFAN
jgi:hypothetical protein